MIRVNTKKGTRVIIKGFGKSAGRVGTLLNADTPSLWTYKCCSVRLDATSTKPACNIVINRKNVEKV